MIDQIHHGFLFGASTLKARNDRHASGVKANIFEIWMLGAKIIEEFEPFERWHGRLLVGVRAALGPQSRQQGNQGWIELSLVRFIALGKHADASPTLVD